MEDDFPGLIFHLRTLEILGPYLETFDVCYSDSIVFHFLKKSAQGLDQTVHSGGEKLGDRGSLICVRRTRVSYIVCG